MTHYAMVIEVDRCIGCYNCFVACRDEHAGIDHLPISAAQPRSGQSWIHIQECERGTFPKVKVSYIPVLCQQCSDAPCVSVARDGAVYRRDDGIVLIDPVKATGQQSLVASCPYNVIVWNDTTNVPQKCTFCAHLLDVGWKEPRCVEVCPTQAMVFVDIDEPDSSVSKRRVDDVNRLRPEFGTNPLVGYRGLPKRFIAGEIVFADNDDVAGGVSVSLQHGDDLIITATDAYGDFEFENLDENVEYVLSVAHPGYRPLQLTVSTIKDLNLGCIALDPFRARFAKRGDSSDEHRQR